MKPSERLKEMENKYGPFGLGSPEDVSWLIARVKLLTAELEAVAHSNAVPLFVKRSARRVLEGVGK